MNAPIHAPIGAGRVLLISLLAGCLVLAPHLGRAEKGAAGSPPPATDNASEARTVWDLGNVVEIALANHPRVQGADDEITAAAARKGQAGASYYPTINLSSAYTGFQGFSSVTGRSFTTSSSTGKANLSQVILDFGRRGAGVRQAESLLSASRETGKATRQEIAFQVKAAYFNVLRARRTLSVNEETLAQRDSLLRQARAFYDAGIRAKIDVARAEASLYQARADLTAAENGLRVARITLLNWMGIDGPRDFDLLDTLAAESLPGSVEEWVREAEEGRPDLRALIDKERAAEGALAAARAEHLPVLTANGGYGYSGEEFPLRKTHNFSLLFEVPIFSGFLTSERVKEAEASLSSARHAVTDLRRQIRLEVEEATLSIREASDRYEARRKEQEALRENLRLAMGRYSVGVGNIIEVSDAQVQMVQADTAVIEALYDSRISEATLLRATGR